MAKGGFHLAAKWKSSVVSYKTLGLKKGYSWTDFGKKFEDHLAATHHDMAKVQAASGYKI
jgi:hypothetical protein